MKTTYGNYDLAPHTRIHGYDQHAFSGYDALRAQLRRDMQAGSKLFVFDCYPGVDREEIDRELRKLSPDLWIDADTCAYTGDVLSSLFRDNLTDDRVFGVMSSKNLADCMDPDALAAAQEQVRTAQGTVFIVGTGAGLIARGDVYLYFDMARWEIQLRYRAGMPNWRCDNHDDATLSKYKRGFFIEWRMADRHKREQFDTLDYIVDTNEKNHPVMITGEAFRAGMEQLTQQPFRLQPYFDPGVWGGQWMKEHFGLDPARENYAWSFDGVPEENSIRLRFGATDIELPAMNLTLYCPRNLLGARVYGRFGAEFPIRFDLLDTMGGGNLSLQVHPLTQYIQENFGMHYTQDESYYLLDAQDGAHVYLGTKEGIDKEAMLRDLERAQAGEIEFPADTYINKLPVKQHDHVLIPAGTIHCSGAGTMVLEVSATPFIFTFKLWDWNRLGADGLPRPIHLAHGAKNIQWERDTAWVHDQLIHQEKELHRDAHYSLSETGLHEKEFIQTCRHVFDAPISCDLQGSVMMLNLVGGAQVTLSGEGFAPFVLHYAETAIVPAATKSFTMTPSGPSEGQEVKVLTATVR